ncbi:hypothetical protein [Nocardiopsis sp. HUAS JQ3]|nr:hypothetical protein [Nocardiopsis sp. HUAS JQ3]WDZ89104.1 hypothetical protein PV789_19360 [Nocardiopsis sp. HUAS JQ3]
MDRQHKVTHALAEQLGVTGVEDLHTVGMGDRGWSSLYRSNHGRP